MRIIQVDLNKDYYSDVIDEAVNVLNYGGVVIYPTDTLYGLGANALNEIAVKKVFAIKERSFSKPLPIVARNLMWVKELAVINKKREEILNKIWPGKVTAVLPSKNLIPSVLNSGCKSLGIRISDFDFIDKLLYRFGYPLTATSANISGHIPTNDINEIIDIFSKRIAKPDLVIDVGILPKSDPSMILDLTGLKPKILRISPSKPEQLLKLLNI